jgi:AraC-like DNA-binding protein
MGDVRKLPDIITNSQDIGDLRHCDDLCPRAHGASEVLLRDDPVLITFHKAQDRTLSLRSLLPGQKISALKTNREAVQSEFDNLLKNLENTSSDTILQTSLSIHTLLTGLVLRNTVSYSRSQELILQTADYIRAHYNEPIELDTLLAMAHMSKAWYMRLFRQYIGTTPYKYILTQRITKAREYLEVTDMTVHEIAMRTGFSDDASFSTRFSAMTGTSPLSYRKNAITYRQSQTKS